MKITSVKAILTLFLVLGYLSCSAQTKWTKYADNPVFEPGPDNYDIIAVGQPTVLFENDTIKMWYAGVGNDLKSRICYSYSLDGIQWTKHTTPVIDVGEEGEWDDGWLDTPEIVRDDFGYTLYYYGDTAQQGPEISSAIGAAYSTNGIDWIKDENNPVFSKGEPGEWDESWVESPAVLYNSSTGEYLMWYNGVNTATWKIQIGFATSPDGISWTWDTENPVLYTGSTGMYDDMWLGTPAVIFQNELYRLWYASASSNSYNESTSGFDTIHICYATSTDGINWNKHSSNPLFNTFSQPYDTLIDSGGPWAPDVIFNENAQEYMMWFETFAGFSLATAPVDQPNILQHEKNEIPIWIFPNPFTDKLHLDFGRTVDKMSIEVRDIQGTVFLNHHLEKQNNTILNLQELSNGVYIIILYNKNEQNIFRIIKQ